MKKRSKSISAMLALSLFLACAVPVQAASVTGQVYSEIEISNIAVKVTPGDKQLTVAFPKKFSEDVEADSFEITIQKANENTLSAPVKLSASAITTATASYTFKNLTNKTSYSIQVTAFADGDTVAEGSGSGIPVGKPPALNGVTAKAGDGSVTISFNKINGAAPTTYQIHYWIKKDAAGNPIFEKPIIIKAATVKNATFTYVLSKLKNGTTYHFNVFAEKNNEVVAITSDVTATPKAPIKKK
ncbi:fibronectin type III domain-containing protein [Cohnella silvisoli]|uniref:Fibronectin type III domain-containing protein n=1 Tax=Cohnella silvisoli TaxID=2873699 RepID=A0ABV1KN29_9BACL|nr:fibronectin type III domain-containing protein [Cohnella silvisoli]MCD9021212.1 fibronectin type III domain-containing protein [Cohnella silvisoli]